MNARIARELKEPLEALHIPVYWEPEPQQEYKQLGLKGGWMGYFASRSAAMGAVSSGVVIATFYGFHAKLVTRAIPDAWTFAPPERILEARLRGIDAILRRRLGEFVASTEVADAAASAQEALGACAIEGRALFAGHARLPWPDEPHLVLWHAATLYREFRGDGHVALLVHNEIGACESLVLHTTTGGPDKDWMLAQRGWDEAEWDAAVDNLRDRGVLDANGEVTDTGRSMRETIEQRTDELSLAPWEAIGEERSRKLLDLLVRVREVGSF